MYRFALSESANYQNIPRTIQNVFMNSKLDADEIKKTIISSLDDDEAFVDLTYYRSQVASFEQQFKDISLWYRKDGKGQVEIRNLADKVNGKYRDLLALGNAIKDACSQLRYAQRRDDEALPEIMRSLTEQREEHSRQARLISEEEGKHNKQQQGLNREIGALDGKLKELKRLRTYYESIKIGKIIELVESEDRLKAQIDGYRSEKDILAKTSEDIGLRYKLLLDQLRLTFKEQINAIASQKNQLKAGLDNAMMAARQQMLAAKDDILGRYEAETSELKEDVRNVSLEVEKLKHKIQSIGESHPHQEIIDEIREQIRAQEQEQSTKNQEKVYSKLLIDTLISDCEKELARIEIEHRMLVSSIEKKYSELQQQAEAFQDLLKKSEGSFYKWLDDNVPDWKSNIGQIADQEAILYNTGLSPVKADDYESSFYGVRLDLSSIHKEILSPSDIQKKVSGLNEMIQDAKSEIQQAYDKLEAEKSAIQKKYNARLRVEKDKLHDIEVILSSIPSKIKTLNIKLSDAIADEEKVKEAELLKARSILEDTQARLSELLAKENKLQESKSSKQSLIDKDLRTRLKTLNADYEERLHELESKEKEVEAANADKEKEILEQQQTELKGQGVDTDAFDRITRKINEIEATLKRINESRKTYYTYLTHKSELFDCEDEMKQNKNILEAKLRDLDGKFELRYRQLKAKSDMISGRIRALEDEQNGIQEGISQYNQFIADQHFCPLEMSLAGEIKTADRLLDVLNRIRGLIVDRREQKDVFRTFVNRFKSHFSAQNTFNFKTYLESEEDYMAFARDLCEFIDNAKIDEYRTRISDRYGEILQRVAKEIGYLMEHSHQIEKVIADINADFRDKNFTGVIKKIALRSRQSNDQIMQLFMRIYRFVEENGFSMGEYNLFSSDRDATTDAIIDTLFAFAKALTQNDKIKVLTLSDTFRLEFQIIENDNDTGWIEKIANVGSDGTDILVKAMINIMLLNVFKAKISRKFGDFSLHCMMDEIGKLHPTNVKGILEFANMRNIRLINSSPMTYNVSEYKYTYLMSKDAQSNTSVVPLIARL